MLKYDPEFVARLENSVLQIEFDLMKKRSEVVKVIDGPDDNKFILMFGKPDPRRNSTPLMFSTESTWCFCKLNSTQIETARQMSPASNLWIDSERYKAIQYSTICSPEPRPEHFMDMLKLVNQLKSNEIMMVINLFGSGASMPQHFHTQIWPLSYQCEAERKPNTIGLLLNNITIDSSKTRHLQNPPITVHEVVFPVWGLQIEFDKEYVSSEGVGRKLFAAVQEKIRLESQLHLTYNLHTTSSQPNKILVLFREVWKERPFQTDEIFKIVRKFTNSEKATQIKESYNAMWRWGWLECLGGLPTRDDAFSNTEVVSVDFWGQIYDFMSVDDEWRSRIRARVEQELAHKMR